MSINTTRSLSILSASFTIALLVFLAGAGSVLKPGYWQVFAFFGIAVGIFLWFYSRTIVQKLSESLESDGPLFKRFVSVVIIMHIVPLIVAFHSGFSGLYFLAFLEVIACFIYFIYDENF
jgi:type II secretory pathway component PulF